MSIEALATTQARALVINCSTRHLSTLAVASILAHTPLDVLLVDCESTDGSLEHFSRLRDRLDGRLEVASLPLRPHGETLDRVVREVPSDRLLLVDSDLEILHPGIYEAMCNRLASEDLYGSGLLHRGGWMSRESHGLANGTTYYMDRMWIPLSLLDVARTRRVLDAGASFAADREYRGGVLGARIARMLSWRFRAPGLRDLPWLLERRRYDAADPSVREYDTGARVHERALAMGYHFGEISSAHYLDVNHVEGATRAARRGLARRILVGTGLLPAGVERSADGNEDRAIARLREIYPTLLS